MATGTATGTTTGTATRTVPAHWEDKIRVVGPLVGGATCRWGVRTRTGEDLGNMSLESFADLLNADIAKLGRTEA